ncbi:SH3 domain-containing protein [Nannocystaceae bacterium ST9]
MRWTFAPLALTLALALLPASSARADVVDDAYAAGSAAAAAGDWPTAIEHWQRALDLLPGRSAELEYDLGTAYANVGELGRATWHLERSLQPELRPSVELAEAARRNLGIVRRQAEFQAELQGAEISRPDTWWDLFIIALASPALGWATLLAAWALLPVLVWRWRVGQATSTARDRRGVTTVIAILLASLAAIGGILHAVGLNAAHDSPEAIALDPLVEVREGPGMHVPAAFQLQGGSHVRVLEQRSGWTRVRLPGGLEGWAPDASIARLDEPEPVRTRVRAAPSPAESPIDQ